MTIYIVTFTNIYVFSARFQMLRFFIEVLLFYILIFINICILFCAFSAMCEIIVFGFLIEVAFFHFMFELDMVFAHIVRNCSLTSLDLPCHRYPNVRYTDTSSKIDG